MKHYDLDGALVRWSGKWTETPEIFRKGTRAWEPYPHAPRLFAEGTPLSDAQVQARVEARASLR